MLKKVPKENDDVFSQFRRPFKSLFMGSAVVYVIVGQAEYIQWPESSALGNAADFCLATLPIVLPPKNFLLKIA